MALANPFVHLPPRSRVCAEQLQLYTAPLVEHLESNPPPEDGGSRLEETAGDTDGTNERPEALAETSSDRDPSDAEEQEATSQLASSGEESAGSDGEGESPAGSEGEGESPADSAAARKRPTGLSNQYRGGSRGKANVSAVDDDFFKLSEMKMFLEQEDRAEDLKRAKGDAAAFDDASASSEEEDYLEEMFGEHGADLSGEESEGEAGEEGEAGLAEESDGDVSVPSDFEGSGTGADGKPDEPEEPEGKPASDLFGDDGPSAEAQGLSRYEAEQLRMKRHIQRLEEENVSEKPWQMTGEAAARARPVDSLLQEDLDFEQLTRPAPEVTIETTQSLEDIIIQRIKDQLWDDVERKNTGPDKPFRPKSMQELDQEQNKEGLGEVYAKDFLAQQAGENSAASKAETQLKAKHKEISDLMATLSRKMNALTNFHYTVWCAGLCPFVRCHCALVLGMRCRVCGGGHVQALPTHRPPGPAVALLPSAQASSRGHRDRHQRPCHLHGGGDPSHNEQSERVCARGGQREDQGGSAARWHREDGDRSAARTTQQEEAQGHGPQRAGGKRAAGGEAQPWHGQQVQQEEGSCTFGEAEQGGRRRCHDHHQGSRWIQQTVVDSVLQAAAGAGKQPSGTGEEAQPPAAARVRSQCRKLQVVAAFIARSSQ